MTSPLEPDRRTREETAAAVLAFINDWLDAAADMPAGGDDPEPSVLADLQRAPSESGKPIQEILHLLEQAGQGGIYHPSGGHMSYIPNSGMYDAALGEFLAASLNRYTGIAGAAPGMTAIEHGVCRWMCDMFDFGPESAGIILSGGSTANFTAIVTARTSKLGDDFGNGVIYVTPHTHHSAAKAARLAGFRQDQLVKVPVDADLKMDIGALDRRDRRRPLRRTQPILGHRISGDHRHRCDRSDRPGRRGSSGKRNVDACRRCLWGVL